MREGAPMAAGEPTSRSPLVSTRAGVDRGGLLACALVVAAGCLAWWGVWRAQFLFDDGPAIVDNAALQAGHWWQAAFGAEHQPLANRPLACLSLVLDFWLFGPGPFGPHLTNLLLHLGNALLVLVVVRGALRSPNLAGRFDAVTAIRLATSVAVLWVAHPLAGDAVAYATQRSTLLFSGFLLVALCAALRAAGSAHGARWRAVAVLAVACGMASKEDMVGAPLLLLLWERAFVVSSWSALRQRFGYFVALAATWLVLGGCLLLGPHNATVGYGQEQAITAWQWLLTQAGVLVHYLRLVVWPQPLRGAYDWGVVTEVGAALLPGAVVLLLLGFTCVLWRRRPWWGLLGALFFLLLAPTSSVLPIFTEIVAERRMYLPMLAVLVPLVVFGGRTVRGTSFVLLVAAVTVAFGIGAWSRIAVHANEAAFWADAYHKRTPGSRTHLAGQILSNQGAMSWSAGRPQEAVALFDESMLCADPTTTETLQYAVGLQFRGRHGEAIDLLRRLLQKVPTDAEVLGTLGTCLVSAFDAEKGKPDDARLAEAARVLQLAVERKPQKAAFWNSLGFAEKARGRLSEAEQAYRHATELSTEQVAPFLQRADVLQQLGRQDEIAPMFQRLVAARPRDVDLRLYIAERDLQRRDVAAAVVLLQQVLAIDPSNQRAGALLQQAQQATGR